MMKPSLTFLLLLAAVMSFAQHPHTHGGRVIEFPDVPGFKTLKCDLHIHTVFSDGEVWPTIRVEEAVKDGLDAIAVTDHLEYQPHRADIPHPDRNRTYEIVKRFARSMDLLTINGSEITRRMPVGHCNAVFLQDANALLLDDSIAVFREARRQGAFIFWNHPNWVAQAPDGIARLSATHRQLLAEGLIDGIEVVNEMTYSDEALQIALEHNLSIMGTSDIHGLVDWQFNVPEGGHRPVTLVFAKEKTEAALKEALLARRTAVWFNNTLIGREEHLLPLLQSSLEVLGATYEWDRNRSVAKVRIQNHSDADFHVENLSPYTFHAHARFLTLKAHEITEIEVKTLEQKSVFNLLFRVLNGVTAPGEHPVITLPVEVSKDER